MNDMTQKMGIEQHGLKSERNLSLIPLSLLVQAVLEDQPFQHLLHPNVIQTKTQQNHPTGTAEIIRLSGRIRVRALL